MPRRNYQANPDTVVDHLVPVAEAIKIVKRSLNRQMYVMVQFNAPAASDPETHTWPLISTIKVSLPEAVRFLKETYTGRFETEALVKLHLSQYCLHIG